MLRGTFLTFDLLPLELSIEPLVARLLGALRDDATRLRAAELCRVLPGGRCEPVWEAGGGGGGRARRGLGALALVILLPAAICTFFGVSARRQREASAAMVARGMPPMHRGFATWTACDLNS